MTWPVGIYSAFLMNIWRQLTSQADIKPVLNQTAASILSTAIIKLQYNSWGLNPKPIHCPPVNLKEILALPKKMWYQNAK